VLLLYRAAESGPEYKCTLGLATSKDGYHFERVSDQPTPSIPSIEGFDGATIQDPRLIKIGDWFYVTYACRHYPVRPVLESRRAAAATPSPTAAPEFPHYLRTNATLTGLAMTRDFKTWVRAGWITDPTARRPRRHPFSRERFGGKFVLLHRPLEWVGEKYGTEHACVWICEAADDHARLPASHENRLLIKQQASPGRPLKIGINVAAHQAPPHGWLTIYHAVWSEDKFYRLGALLLDLHDPGKVLHRTPDFLLQPEEPYELEGFYQGRDASPAAPSPSMGRCSSTMARADQYCALATCPLAGADRSPAVACPA
jgi:beta-1,2-mannobiose phosphorylase / 1,2-beta-oligomannan phosphorylase